MKNSMIIKHTPGNAEHFICSCTPCAVSPDEEIPTFYSYLHAIDSGWIPTKDIKYSETGEPVWVCPRCKEKEGEKEE